MEEMYNPLNRSEQGDQTQQTNNTNNPPDANNNNNNNNSTNNTSGSGSSWGWGWGLGSIVDAVKQSSIVDVVKQSNIVDAVKQKSSNIISMYTEDLQEFKKTIQKDTTEVIKKIDNTQITEKITKGVTSLLSDLQLSPNTPQSASSTGGEVVPSTSSSRSQPVSRWEAQVIALEENPATFTTDIENGNVDEEYRKWKETFSLKNQNEDIINLLSSRSRLRDAHTRLVPTPLSHAIFWERYYYRLHKLKSEEEKREKLLKSTMEGGIDEELTWDVDEESESSDATHQETKQVIEKELIEETEPSKEKKEEQPPQSPPVSEQKETEKEVKVETPTPQVEEVVEKESEKEEEASEETEPKEEVKATEEESAVEPSTPKKSNTSTSNSPISPRDEDSWEMVDSPPSQNITSPQTVVPSTNSNTTAEKPKSGNDEEEWSNWE
eukprot:TRINITY_DN7333_c0_g2_i1.p1 TRINITY_DN7333_c0_g2~~TRINITY_DN7333_c0_g2_i1.p1  ORF type:complete len:437 (+),score=167.77 TRINITY_DN7333_c0_g2_i1:164-1474(+)